MIYLNLITRHLLYTNASLLLLSLQEQSLAEQKELQMEELIRSWNKLIKLVHIILNKEDAWTRKTYQQNIRTVDLCFASANKTKKKLHIVDDKRRFFFSIAFFYSFKQVLADNLSSSLSKWEMVWSRNMWTGEDSVRV
jgi:hypothetical protein